MCVISDLESQIVLHFAFTIIRFHVTGNFEASAPNDPQVTKSATRPKAHHICFTAIVRYATPNISKITYTKRPSKLYTPNVPKITQNFPKITQNFPKLHKTSPKLHITSTKLHTPNVPKIIYTKRLLNYTLKTSPK